MPHVLWTVGILLALCVRPSAVQGAAGAKHGTQSAIVHILYALGPENHHVTACFACLASSSPSHRRIMVLVLSTWALHLGLACPQRR